MRRGIGRLAGVLLVVVGLLGIRFVWLAAPGGVGLAAKQLCSLVYVSGLDPDRARSLYVDDAISPLSRALEVRYDHDGRRVHATALGLWSAVAREREGLGCTLSTGVDSVSHFDSVALPDVHDRPLRYAAAGDVGHPIEPDTLQDALDEAFDPAHDTMAVVVLYNGEIVAERYAEDITASTPLPGWSMAKSVTATLIGLLVERGRLDIHEPGAVAAWRGAGGSGRLVTIDQLLRMTSGLDVTEDQTGADPNTRMLFTQPDAAAYAAARGLKAAPGTRWEYMSGNTILAARAVVDATGGSLQTSQSFIREALFDPLGASSFVMEPDPAGTFIGSSFALASAHDWAKLGQLYLDDGVWEGERLLPEGWVDYVTAPTPQSGENGYGAGFWLANGDGLPDGAFYANGFQGQFVVVVPSHSLVVARLGAGHGPTGIERLVDDLVSSMRPHTRNGGTGT